MAPLAISPAVSAIYNPEAQMLVCNTQTQLNMVQFYFILPYRKTQSRFYSGSISYNGFDASQQTVNIQNGYNLYISSSLIWRCSVGNEVQDPASGFSLPLGLEIINFRTYIYDIMYVYDMASVHDRTYVHDIIPVYDLWEQTTV